MIPEENTNNIGTRKAQEPLQKGAESGYDYSCKAKQGILSLVYVSWQFLQFWLSFRSMNHTSFQETAGIDAIKSFTCEVKRKKRIFLDIFEMLKWEMNMMVMSVEAVSKK